MRVAISGAGVAGPTLAYWLARSGHQPLLIECASAPRTGGYMIDFWGLGYTVAERMGLLPQLRLSGYAVREVRFLDKKGRKTGGFATSSLRRLLHDRFISLPRGDLAGSIQSLISDHVETIFDTEIVSVDEHADGVSLAFSHGPQREFDLLVGADGLHSNVRRLIFGSQDKCERSVGYRVAAFEVCGYRPRDELTYVSYCAPGRQISRFAKRNDRTMFLLVFGEERYRGDRPRDLAGRKDVLCQIFSGFGSEWSSVEAAMDSAGDLYFDDASQIAMNRWSLGRVALVGDAAACASLLAGEGAGLAMIEAYVLAGELQRAGTDYVEAFRRYESRLRQFVEGKQTAARRFAATFAPRTSLGLWLRNKTMSLMTVPGLAGVLLGKALRDDLDLPTYPM